MTAITVTFTNPATLVEHTFENVKNVEWSSEYSTNVIVDQVTNVGKKVTRFSINGFILVGGTPSDNVVVQQTLEAALIAVGIGTLTYTGATDVTDTRFISLEFQEYRGNPVATYTAVLETETANPHGHEVVIGALTLSSDFGFNPPRVTDTIAAQGPDEQINNLRSREITIEGELVGTLQDVNDAQANLIAEIADKDTVVVDLSSGSGGVLLTCRPGRVTFGAPERRGGDVAKTFSFRCKTHDRYDLEPFTLGELPSTFGGTITLDVVSSLDHNPTTELDKVSNNYSVMSETLSVTGKKYFISWSEYDIFLQSFAPLPVNVHFESFFTYNRLELTDVDVGELQRDGNFAVDNTKRFSATVQLNFTWKKGLRDLHEQAGVTRLGILWFKLSTTTHGVSLDEFGNVNQRNVNISGQIFEAELVKVKGLVGTSVLFTDPQIPELTDDYFITSVGINKTETIFIISLGEVRVFDITISATQLATAAQSVHFLLSTFKTNVTGDNVLFERVTSRTKSISNRFFNNAFRVTSMTMSMSGEVWDDDSGGEPLTPNKVLDIFNKIDALLVAEQNINREGATVDDTFFIPTNYNFFLNNFTVGEWQPFILQKTGIRGTQGTKLWKTVVSMSATINFDPGTATDTQPDSVTTQDDSIEDETSKFTTLQVLGFGSVFKRIGVNPSKSTTVIQRNYKNAQLFDDGNDTKSNIPQGFSLDPPSSWVFVATANHEVTKDAFESRGTVSRWTRAFIAVKASDDLSG